MTNISTKLNNYEVIWKDEALTKEDIKKAIDKENLTRKKMRYAKVVCFVLALLFACFYKISPLGSVISYHMITIACLCFITWAILFCSHRPEPIPNTERILGFFQEKHIDLLNHLNKYKLVDIESRNTDNNDEIFLFHFLDNDGKQIIDTFSTGLFGTVCKKYENSKLVKVFDFSSYDWDSAIKQTAAEYKNY